MANKSTVFEYSNQPVVNRLNFELEKHEESVPDFR